MDTITEILQDFFVSSRSNKKLPVADTTISTHLTSSEQQTDNDNTCNDNTCNDNTDNDNTGNDTTCDDTFTKYILKASDFSKHVVFIVNDDPEENISTLNYLLYKLNLMKNLDNTFNHKIQLMLSSIHKTLYKKMILENSYLYFTDFDSQTDFSKCSTKSDNNLKSVIVTDFQSINFDIFKLVAKKSHIYVLVNNIDDNFIQFYKNLKHPKLLIHNKSKLKMVQKQFYKRIIKVLCNNYTNNFDDFFNQINDENLDIRLLILKNNQLLFN